MHFYGGKKNYNNIYNETNKNKKPLITEKEIKYRKALLEVFKDVILENDNKVKRK